MKYYLNNPLSNNGINEDIPGVEAMDATKLDYPEFFAGLKEDDEVVLIGGDGTINYLINHVDVSGIKNNIYIYGNGTGNDFLNDIGCTRLQGYLFGKPIPKGALYDRIHKGELVVSDHCL